MPTVKVSVDGRAIGSIGAQLDGNPHNPDAMPPLRVQAHRRPPSPDDRARQTRILTPGDGGWAILHEVFLTPADAPDVDTLRVMPPARWRTLCGGRFDWIEVVRG